MIIISGFAISILTFPGVIIHELAHQLFCWLCGLEVYEVKYIQLKNPCGYVIHEACENPVKTFLVSIGPLIVNTILGILILIPVTINVFVFGELNNLLNLVILWLGISILMHAFPSKQDGQVMVDQILNNKDISVVAKILTAPIIFLVQIGAFGTIVWLDLIYAMAVAMLLPTILTLFF